MRPVVTDEFVKAPFIDGPLEGAVQILPAKFTLNGAESWYPERAPDEASERSADRKRATGQRYILRVTDDVAEFYHQPDIKLINREDVAIGLNVMQGVYTIAIILGFRSALEAAYPIIVHPLAHTAGQLGHLVLLLALSTIMLLGLRFFWVTRNLYTLVIDTPLDEADKRIAAIVRYHFAITLLHAIIFFVLCDSFRSLVELKPHAAISVVKPLVDRFILVTVILLMLNGVWLLVTFLPTHIRKPEQRDVTRAAVTWAGLNIAFAALATIWLYGSHAITSSMSAVLVVASIVFLANSVLDLYCTAESYIKFPGKTLVR
jgi:hypothetical protein